jgi:hypothetical protein
MIAPGLLALKRLDSFGSARVNDFIKKLFYVDFALANRRLKIDPGRTLEQARSE